MLRMKILAKNIRRIIINRKISFYVFFIPLSLVIHKSQAVEKEAHIEFDKSFLNGMSVDLSSFSDGNPIPAGMFNITVIINNKEYGKYDILFKKKEGKISAIPWLTRQQIDSMGIITSLNDGDDYHPIEDWVKGVSYDYDSGNFVLNLSVPQGLIKYRPKGYISPDMWQKGINVGFMNYNLNYYVAQEQESDNKSSSIVSGYKSYLSTFIDGGINIHDWHFRTNFNVDLTGDKHLDTTNRYVDHSVPFLNSVFTAGEKPTNGDILPSFQILGLNLETDTQMLADSYNTYHPIVNGVADTNAQIIIMQNGHQIYKTNVTPGPFELKDVLTSDYSNDLELIIKEANGNVKTRTIPVAHPPLILTKGQVRYSASVGRISGSEYKTHPMVLMGTWRQGLTSNYTYFTGIQATESYKAFAIGNSFNTWLGGVSVNLIQSITDLNNNQKMTGHSLGISYSKLISATGTSLSLASYRNATKGYYTLQESLNQNTNKNNKYKKTSEIKENIYDRKFKNHHMKHRLSLTLSQRIKNVGFLSISAMLVKYWDDDEVNKQYNLRFTRNEKYFSWAVGSMLGYNRKGASERAITLSISVPFAAVMNNDRPLFSSWDSDAAFNSDNNSSVSSNLYGSSSDQLSYGVGYRRDQSTSGQSQSFNGSANYSHPYGQLNSSITIGKLKQFSISSSGSLVFHRGGIIATPMIGYSPFVIIDARGAGGTKIYNGNYSKINSSGYGVLTGLMPYRKNEVRLDLESAADDVDIDDNIQTVIPEDGSALLVKVKTKVGQAMFIVIKDKYERYLPLATSIIDDNGNSLGLVGQSGITYIRGWNMAESKLYALDDNGNKKCSVTASKDMIAKVNEFNKDIIRLEAKCT